MSELAKGNWEVTDTMLFVADMQSAILFWRDTVGMTVEATTEDWVSLIDATTRQRIVLTHRELLVHLAIGIRVEFDSFNQFRQLLLQNGAIEVRPPRADDAMPFCLLRVHDDIHLLVFAT